MNSVLELVMTRAKVAVKNDMDTFELEIADYLDSRTTTAS
jgi:hypothetical protein